jgi:glycosyltransferase involved in cell wall biosynthesis
MHITAAIATYNRADELRRTLETMMRIEPSPGDDHDVIVVDNKSTDTTPQVIEKALPLFKGRLRGVREETQGLSPARNRAIAESRGDVVAFLDDDVDVDSGWLKGLCAAYREHDAAAVGGRSPLVYPSHRPRWIDEPLEHLLSQVEHGDEPKEVAPGDLFGVNLSFRRDWLDRVGLFRTDLGRVGGRLFGGEEADMLERVAAAGGQIWYEPRAVVGHRVPPERVRRGWFLSRTYWGSFGEIRAEGTETTIVWLARRGWYATRAFGRFAAACLRHGPNSPHSFRHLCTASGQAGCCYAILGQLGSRHSKPRTT